MTSAIARETKLLPLEVRKRMWLFSGKGLVVRAREASLQDKVLPYAHDFPHISTLVEAIRKLKPRCGARGTFSPLSARGSAP